MKTGQHLIEKLNNIEKFFLYYYLEHEILYKRKEDIKELIRIYLYTNFMQRKICERLSKNKLFFL